METQLKELKKTFEGIVNTLKAEEYYVIESNLRQSDKESLFSIIDGSIKNIKTQIEYINSLL